MAAFRSEPYIVINARRMEHLASIGLPLEGKTVLELGAGIGDLTGFFRARGCRVAATEGRGENFAVLRERYRDDPLVTTHEYDLDPPRTPPELVGKAFDVVFCYGLLYHLSDPDGALDAIANACGGTLLLSTRVSRGEEPSIVPVSETAANPWEAVSGRGCRPTRPWVWNALHARFRFVYSVRTQPRHPEFPVDWTDAGRAHDAERTRCVFIASRAPIENPLLVPELLMKQQRQP